MHLNQPYQLRYEANIILNCRHINEASKANLDSYKRTIKWQSFFEQVYIEVKANILQQQYTIKFGYPNVNNDELRLHC